MKNGLSFMDAPDLVAGQTTAPAEAMRFALKLARNGAGSVSPNPMVGCVIVDADHRFIAGGWHVQLGGKHAEIDAIDRMAERLGSRTALAGCHLYVTLEPCAHEGRTPSCAKTLVPLRPASVTFALVDPNPLVAGQGRAILKAAGVRAEALAEATTWPARPEQIISEGERRELIDGAEEVAEIFLWNMLQPGLPFVTVKVASTLDGKVALQTGESRWITGEAARAVVHQQRREHDAVVVGRGTLEADDPALDIRIRGRAASPNSVVILDPTGRSLSRLREYRVSKVREKARVIVCVGPQAKGVLDARDEGYTIVNGPLLRNADIGTDRDTDRDGNLGRGFDLRSLLAILRGLGLSSLFVEGGPRTIGPFLQSGLAQRLHLFQAPMILGGRHGLGWSDQFGVNRLSDSLRLQKIKVAQVGDDLHITGRL